MSRFLLPIALLACNGPDDTVAPVDLTAYPQGDYLMNLSIALVGGLAVPFQLHVDADDRDGAAVFSTLELRAWSPTDDTVSELLVSASDVPVDLETGFVADLPEFVLPGAYSVTHSDVTVQATLTADEVSPDGMCGTVEGQLVTFDLDLAGSTFGAIPFDQRASGAPTQCGETVTEIPRIETCPTLVDGLNADFPSGGQSREFEIVLPSDYDPGQQYPLIVVYHGFGDDIASMLDEGGLRPYADAMDVILAAPQGLESGGTTLFDAFSDPATNLDAVLFDDLVTCAQESFSIDPDRIHVTGMSNGGLETGYLIATRNSVIASAAPLSGGIGVPYDPEYAMPVLVTWGGPTDSAFEQDFDQLAHDMISELQANGEFVADCDHGQGHYFDATFWPWVLQFLLDHPRGVTPEPYAGGLPAVFPDYCEIP
jgi:predicted esterase